MKNTKALQFGARFSLPPNSLGYCGKNTAAHKFKECIINGKCDGIEKEIEDFIVLHPYLQALSEISKRPKYSKEVIEGYWLGNELLKKVKPQDYMILMKYFKKQGVPDFFIKELISQSPEVFIPNHLFQVLYIGVGRASGSVPFNIDTINNCMIRWGKVEKIDKNEANVKLNSLENRKDNYKLMIIKQNIPFDSKLVVDLKNGDIVAVHWNMIIKKLDKEELEKLEYWTKRVIELNFPN